MKSRGLLHLCKVSQSSCIGAVLAANDKHRIHLAGHCDHFGLPVFRGRANGVKNNDMRTDAFNFFDNPVVIVDILRRLSNDTHLIQGGNFIRVLLRGDDHSPAARVTQKAVNLGVFLVADDDDGIIKGRVFFNNGLDITNFRAGRINDFNTAFLDFFSFSRSNAVGTDD